MVRSEGNLSCRGPQTWSAELANTSSNLEEATAAKGPVDARAQEKMRGTNGEQKKIPDARRS